MSATQDDRDVVQRLEGLFEGQLNEDEIKSFYRCIQDGYAHRSYEGVSGFLGLAKVRVP